MTYMTYGDLINRLDEISSGLVGKKAEGKTVARDDQVIFDLLQLVTKIRVPATPTEIK